MFLLFIILSALFIYLIFFVAQFINVLWRGYPPFISTGRETIEKIISEVQVKNQAVIYELGCGRAGFLRQAEKIFPQAELIGLENLLIPYLITKIHLAWQGSRIKLFRKDFFTIDLKTAALVYCYLNNMTMEKLGQKFKRECLPGTQIISRSFPISRFEPEKVIKLKNKKVYFYKI